MGAGNSPRYARHQSRQTVYPRGCGELLFNTQQPRPIVGLSPWVRGTRPTPTRNIQAGRFIPVGAGNSRSIRRNTASVSVYPRGCGELESNLAASSLTCGLSPWVRGTHRRARRFLAYPRFIPVGAGNSASWQTGKHFLAVYPRGCGELGFVVTAALLVAGLSPWVRGTLFPTTRQAHDGRFIPVGAGNSSPKSLAASHSSVYPRGCGELFSTDV